MPASSGAREETPQAEEPPEDRGDGRRTEPDPAARADAYRWFAVAAGIWAAGATLIGVANVSLLVEGATIGGSGVPSPLLHGATLLGFAAAVVFCVAAMIRWSAAIEAIEEKEDRWVQEDRYKAVRWALVLGFGFLAGMWFWSLNMAIVPVFAIGIGALALALAGYRIRPDIPERARVNGGVAAVLVAAHPLSVLVLKHLAAFPTAAGFALAGYAFHETATAVQPVEEDGDDETDQAAPAP